MIDEVFSGATPKYAITITDELGNEVDAGDDQQCVKTLVEIYDEETKTVLAKFAYPAQSGYVTAVIQNKKFAFILTNTMTTEATKNKEYGVIVETHLVTSDTAYGGGNNIVIKRGTLVIIKDPKE